MIKKFYSLITIYLEEKIIIESYYTTDKGDDYRATNIVKFSISEEQLQLYKHDPARIPDINEIFHSIIINIHKEDKKRVYSIDEASITFIAYNKDFEIIFIKPYTIYIDFLRDDVTNISIGYGLYAPENVSFNEKDKNIMC